MEILITYQDQIVKAVVISDYKVGLSQEDVAEYRGKLADKDALIELDQCRECGEWKSEDEELYGAGYCGSCSQICNECQLYFGYKNMIKVGDGEYICKKCNVKE